MLILVYLRARVRFPPEEIPPNILILLVDFVQDPESGQRLMQIPSSVPFLSLLSPSSPVPSQAEGEVIHSLVSRGK
jgi:hypothetical protein